MLEWSLCGQCQDGTSWMGCLYWKLRFYPIENNGVASSLALYTCDPVAVCKTIGMTTISNTIHNTIIGLSNSCNTMDDIPNFIGCCCDQNLCMTSASISVKSSEQTTPKPTLLSTVGTTKAASPYLSQKQPLRKLLLPQRIHLLSSQIFRFNCVYRCFD